MKTKNDTALGILRALAVLILATHAHGALLTAKEAKAETEYIVAQKKAMAISKVWREVNLLHGVFQMILFLSFIIFAGGLVHSFRTGKQEISLICGVISFFMALSQVK